MPNNDLSTLNNYYAELLLIDESTLSFRNKYIRLKCLLEHVCKDITSCELLQFPSLFSRIVFIAQKYKLPEQLEWQLQNIRVKSNFLFKNEKHIISNEQYFLAKTQFELFLSILFDEKVAYQTLNTDTKPEKNGQLPMDRLRVQVLKIDKQNQNLICKSDVLQAKELVVSYKYLSTTPHFNEIIEQLWIGAQLNLINIKIDGKNSLLPQNIVLEPDFLIDVSNIADCFQNYGNSHLYYFFKKFEQNGNSKHILLGNLANFFLDELIYSDKMEELSFEIAFFKSFRQMPFEYASCKEISETANFKDFMIRARSQFENIKRVLLYDMLANGFSIKECILEPSFFCEKFGFQGRLDLLQPPNEENEIARIIELKSGKTPFPREDVSRIAPNHEAQTAIYRLIIQTVFNKQTRQIYPSILYSAAEHDGENLRMAAPYKKLDQEIVNIRNLIVAIEHDLYLGINNAAEKLFNQLTDINSYSEKLPPFHVDKLKKIKQILNSSSLLEKEYFYRFVSFISRELYLQKAGDGLESSSISISALWNTCYEERQKALELISDLEIINIDDSGRDMRITFKRSEYSQATNFREGEICILYPHLNENNSVLTSQILKGNIDKIESDEIVIRFRYKQRNRKLFEKHTSWTIEHDKLDHSFNAMFKSLFTFLSSSSVKKKLILGITPPHVQIHNGNFPNSIGIEEKKNSIVRKALEAKDYFLIVGPPGTGKTSVFIRDLIEKLYEQDNKNILIIAYTNKAVDELCAAICSAFDSDENCDSYIRIGTELSCNPLYRKRLLQIISQEVRSRRELQQIIEEKRIFIGTLASITGKPELFSMKRFDTAIIDEASQILEPQIVGLLPLFDKFIMIGDHKQLSTITLQDANKSVVSDEKLNSIELYDCRESLFERLFRVCKKNSWKHAYDTLTYHGRMHEQLAKFVNKYFYDNQLETITPRQINPLNYYLIYDENNKYQKLIANQRIGFIASRTVDYTDTTDKINHAEANIIVDLAKNIFILYKENKLKFVADKTIGIITPYRNQIAIIKQKLEATNIPELNGIMVDTVERYQGSQRDIILVSFCFNKSHQLNSFINMDRDGIVDRKLNVTLTRAREQLFLVGNDLILSQNLIYKNLLDEIDIV